MPRRTPVLSVAGKTRQKTVSRRHGTAATWRSPPEETLFLQMTWMFRLDGRNMPVTGEARPEAEGNARPYQAHPATQTACPGIRRCGRVALVLAPHPTQ